MASSSLIISKIVKVLREQRQQQSGSGRLCVVGSGTGLARVVGALSAGAADERDGVSSALDALAPADFPRTAKLAGRWDVVVVVAEGSAAADMAPVVQAARGAGARVVGLAQDMHGGVWSAQAGVAADEVARSVGHRGGKTSLEARIVHAAGDAAEALAVTLPALRRAYCDRVIFANAAQNGAIGAVVIIPGADLPAMTANQVRMVLKIAAVYGEPLTRDRALEILSVVGTGFALRALARQALPFTPGLGWAVKGAVGFSGTVALGQAAVAYFEAGAPLRVSRMQRIDRQLERARSRLPGLLQRGLASG